jgi:hypothetical protein
VGGPEQLVALGVCMNDFDMVRASPRSPEGQAALDRIEAEVERLRAALEKVELQTTQDWIRNIARNALAEEKV